MCSVDAVNLERGSHYARDVGYIEAAGQSFRDFMKGRLPALPGELPTIKDWSTHLNTIYPEAWTPLPQLLDSCRELF